MSVVLVVWSLGAVVTRISRICTVKMSESRFRSRISQERRTEGWKRERNSKQKTTVKSVVIKIDLGGEKKRREGIQGIRQTEEVCGLRMSKGQGAKIRTRAGAASGQGMGMGMGMAWHDTSMMQAQERSAELKTRQTWWTWCLGQRREAVGARGDREAREVASLVELTG
jgi:hypothetical protein